MSDLTSDPAATGFPPARFADRFAWSPPQDAQRALLLTARALEGTDPVEVLAVIGGLRAGLSVAEVLEALEGLAGSTEAARGSGRWGERTR